MALLQSSYKYAITNIAHMTKSRPRRTVFVLRGQMLRNRYLKAFHNIDHIYRNPALNFIWTS